MSVAWVAYVLIAGVFLAAAAQAADVVCRIAGRPRRWAWIAGMLATIALAAIAPAHPRSERPSAPPDSRGAPPSESAPQAIGGALLSTSSDATVIGAPLRMVARTIEGVLVRVERVAPEEFATWHAISWIMLSTLMLLLLILVLARFHRARRHWPLSMLHGARVRVSPASGPAVMGVRHPEIVVPRWLLSRSASEQRMVIWHEREHLRARDPLMLSAAWLCAVAMPWNPVIWWMLSRVRLAVELDCDARVLRRGESPREYGTLLIDLTEHCSGLPAGATALLDRGSQLKRRLLAMNSHSERFGVVRGSALALCSVLLFMTACEMRMPTASEVDKVDAAAAERVARQLSFVTSADSAPIYVVDGVPVSRAAGEAMKSDDIASIEIRRATAESPSAMIFITTLDGASREMELVADRLELKAGAFEKSAQTGRGGRGVRTGLSISGGRDSADVVVQVGAGHPMVILDGVIQMQDGVSAGGNPLALNGANIESIEVVRGAAALSLYGARAANGVINIRTKKTNSGR